MLYHLKYSYFTKYFFQWSIYTKKTNHENEDLFELKI